MGTRFSGVTFLRVPVAVFFRLDAGRGLVPVGGESSKIRAGVDGEMDHICAVSMTSGADCLVVEKSEE